MNEIQALYINGAWEQGSGPSFTSNNPANGEILWKGREANAQDIESALIAAKEAFPFWKNKSLAQRIEYIQAFHQVLSKNKAELAEAISKETGKPLWDSYGEVGAMLGKVNISIEAYHARCPDFDRDHPNGRLTTRHLPHGVLAVFGPFNFPGHLPNGHIIPALLAGNTIVFKPSEFTPLVAHLTLKYWQAAGLPPGTINLVQGGRETGRLLSQHRLLDGILFTGSWPTGLSLAEQFAKTPHKILALEMGGNNPLVVTGVKDVQAAAYLTIQSAFLSSGQRCSCARRLIITPEADHFLEALMNMIKKIRVGTYTENPEPFMGPLINAQAAERVLKAQETLLSMGGAALVPLKQLPNGKAFLSPGMIDTTAITKKADEEIFGPLLQLIRVPNFESALEEANRTRFGLTAGLLSDSPEEYEQFSKAIRAGVVNWNAPLTGASSALPFGGVGQSGNNRPSAFYAADYCAYPVASLEAPMIKMPQSISPGIVL